MSNLLVRIVRLPQRGQLFDSTSSSLLAAGDFLFSGVPSEVSYLSSVPANGTDSFFFEVVDAADSSAASLPVEQLVAIRNKNQPPTLVVSTEPFFVHSYFEYSASPSSVLTLHSISFGDIDGDADLVVVYLRSTGSRSMLTLNQTFLSAADFASCSTKRNGRTWTCMGDGTRNSEMRFLAYPSDANLLVDGMQFTSYESEAVVNVSVGICDGSGGNCLAEIEHAGNSVRDDCFCVEKQFSIHVGDFAPEITTNYEQRWGFTLSLQELLALFICLCIFFVACCFCTCRKVAKRALLHVRQRAHEKDVVIELSSFSNTSPSDLPQNRSFSASTAPSVANPLTLNTVLPGSAQPFTETSTLGRCYFGLSTTEERLERALKFFQTDVLGPTQEDPGSVQLSEEKINAFMGVQRTAGLSQYEIGRLKTRIILRFHQETKESTPSRRRLPSLFLAVSSLVLGLPPRPSQREGTK